MENLKNSDEEARIIFSSLSCCNNRHTFTIKGTRKLPIVQSPMKRLHTRAENRQIHTHTHIHTHTIAQYFLENQIENGKKEKDTNAQLKEKT